MKQINYFIPTGRASTKEFQLPDGTRTAARTISELPFEIRNPAKEIHNVPTIVENSLLSIPKMAEAGYITVFDDEQVNIYDARNTKVLVTRKAILRGWYDKTTKLWRLPLVPIVINENTDTVLTTKPPTEFLPKRPPANEAVHNVYELKTQPELIRYLHAAAGFPTKPTWIKAIKNKQFASWPGLTVQAVSKHFPESKETSKGHGRKIKSGLRSTKRSKEGATVDANDDDDEQAAALTERNHSIFLKVYDTEEDAVETIFTDQTGQFPKKSSKGNQYIMVLCDIDSNSILVAAMKNRTSGEMIRAYQELIDRLHSAGIKPKRRHILDNECSEDFKRTITKNDMKFQLVPPNDHQRNQAEKAIQTFKAHFISILCGADKNFPMHLWCQLLPQAEDTLNML
jgi:hypothetical protein